MLGISVSAVLLPTAINIGTGGTAPAFLAPYTGWTWPVIGVLWAVSVAVGSWEMLARQQSAITSRPVDHPRNRPNALDRVEHYVDQRFSQSLAAKARIELDLDERPDAVIRPQSLTVQPVGGTEKAIASNAPISEVFDDLHQSMLILGDPGAGKTTLLLELARALIERARQDAEQPIPVLVDLSGWPGTDDKESGPNDFVQWLRDELRRRYTIPHAVTEAWLAAGKLALLLDGLDEVASEHREECVRELNSLPQKVFVPQIAVCSRLGEYDRLPERLSLHGAVRIQPLTRDRLAEYFEGTGRGLGGVRSMLTSDPELWELLDSPLMLNIMALAVQGTNGEQLRAEDTTTARRELFDAYVCEVLARRVTPPSRYTPRETVRALWFLAMLARDSYRGNTTLRIRFLSSLDWFKCVPLDVAVATTGVFIPVALGAFTAPIVLAAMVRFGLFAGVVTACAAAVATAVTSRDMLPPAGTRSSPHRVKAVRSAVVVGLTAGVGTIGLVLAVHRILADVPAPVCAAIVAAGAAISAGLTAAVHSVVEAVTAWLVALASGLAPLGLALWIGPTEELVGGWVIGLAGSAFIGATTLSTRTFYLSQLTRDAPKNWGFTRQNVICVIAGALVAALLGIAVASPPDTRFLGFAVGLVIGGCGLLAWKGGPGASLLGLLVFRFTGYLPPGRRDFLSHAADRSLLSRSDGEWRFVHLLVRDHLAECDPALLGARAEQRARELAGNRSRQAA
ncbi:NACHT domain-containing protein [Saccharopolyspora shandongensis]|uniref:NACHT domain-containing protein n=1 Tax=Saccharopolyspora shandongensis TaxID=418495 RepID=A0A1H2R711_9PSEU|nr:NACHT domain-containing protein [Saccharopolyspora shandongensis]